MMRAIFAGALLAGTPFYAVWAILEALEMPPEMPPPHRTYQDQG